MTLEMEKSLITTKHRFFLHSILSKKENDTEEARRKEEKTRETIWKRKDEKQKLSSSQIFKTQSKSISETLHNVPHGWRWRRAIRGGAAAVEERNAERKEGLQEKQPELLTLKLGSRFQT
jgi:hypothetical protein